MEAIDSKRDSWKIFNRIAHRYDFLNHFLSLRQDIRWRKKMSRIILKMNINTKYYLDMATGTCDQLLELCKQQDMEKIIGMDMSKNMLGIGQNKINEKCSDKSVFLVRGDGMQMGFRNDYFNLISISFGIRNLPDLEAGLAEMQRVLAPLGYLVILEFSIPENIVFKFFYLFYFRRMLPKLGGVISGDKQAYRYLNNTVETFPYGEKMNAILLKAGFVEVGVHPLFFGIATIYTAKKSGGEGKTISYDT